jgi:hypothetical protein
MRIHVDSDPDLHSKYFLSQSLLKCKKSEEDHAFFVWQQKSVNATSPLSLLVFFLAMCHL